SDVYKRQRTGYRFMGWTLNDQPFTFNASPINGPLRLKASWQAHRYSVKYHSTGGTGSMNDQAFDFDELKALQPNTFTKTGYHSVSYTHLTLPTKLAV
ncbi:InlB B-repeat-containing protein, partial [Enterococcus sp. S181_ASV_20]|nr:InlB B-repeat-containing protein [Enterococcus sp. S181_ASV_20]